jgi:hypothetical protein
VGFQNYAIEKLLSFCGSNPLAGVLGVDVEIVIDLNMFRVFRGGLICRGTLDRSSYSDDD